MSIFGIGYYPKPSSMVSISGGTLQEGCGFVDYHAKFTESAVFGEERLGFQVSITVNYQILQVKALTLYFGYINLKTLLLSILSSPVF